MSDQVYAPLDVTSEFRAPGWLLTARGEVDVTSSTALQAALDTVVHDRVPMVILDIGDVDFMDSSGLRVIVRAGRELADQGGALLLRGARGAVARTLEVTGLLERYGECARN